MAYPLPDVNAHEGRSLLAHTTSIITDVVRLIDDDIASIWIGNEC